MDTLLCNDDGPIINFTVPSATDEILAFHYGNFDNAYGDGTAATAATNGRVYADTVPSTLPAKFGSIGTPSTASGQTTYTWTPPSTSLNANVLVVAGGGGGGGVTGNGASGGGGAGGLVFDTDRTITSGSQTIVVGNGGTGGGNALVNGENGKNSTAFGLTANGGGGGGGSSDDTSWNAGSAGGSGGGGGGGDVTPNGAGGASTQAGTNSGVYIDAGFAGGGSLSNEGDCGGGGGGAGEKGDDFLGASVGNGYNIQGGDGLLLGVFGETYGQSGWFAGGGGAFARNDNIARAGGLGGGGAGGSSGTNHTGGGGGGRDADVTAGNGGSGIVAIRYTGINTIVSNEEIGALDILGSSIYNSVDAAYGLRRLFLAYTGPQVRVRRSTDNTETDISFGSDGTIQDFDLTTWLGGGTAYVTTWYDQSGGAKHLTQTTTTLQPQLQFDDSKYKIYFDGSNVLEHPNDAIFNSVEHTIVARTKSTGTTGDWMTYVSKFSSATDRFFGLWYESNHNRLLYQRYGTTDANLTYEGLPGGHFDVTRTVVARTNSSSTMSFYVDGTLTGSATGSFTANTGPFLVGGSDLVHTRFIGFIDNVMFFTTHLDNATSKILSYPATLL